MKVKVGLKHIEIWNDTLENTVLAYEKEPVVKDRIVFYGPSNFTRWSTQFGMRPLSQDIRGISGAVCAVNRGFGSSGCEHQLYYYPRLVRPLAPRVLVYIPGFGNDQAFGYTNEESWILGQRVLMYAMTDFPELKIYLCGATPVRDMTEEWQKSSEQTDRFLLSFADEHPQCCFVDIRNDIRFHRRDIFIPDGVHFNQTGYDLYADFFREVLKDELAQY